MSEIKKNSSMNANSSKNENKNYNRNPGRLSITGRNKSSSVPQSAIPELKVMRLQSPSLSQPSAGVMGGSPLIDCTLRLPDSFGVIHIGETFTAYLGALNTSTELPVLNLNIKAALQTPTGRYLLASSLDASNSNNSNNSNNGKGFTVPPTEYLSSIVSRPLEEVGQHVLRVEVHYGDKKVFRKYYRFNVSSPLLIRELTVRAGDASCYVSIAIENITTQSPVMICGADFQPPAGLTAQRIDQPQSKNNTNHLQTSDDTNHDTAVNTVQMFDDSGRLSPGSMFRYLFLVKATSQDASIRGITKGDQLGKAVFSWRKTMGEAGRIASTSVLCPPCGINNTNNITTKTTVVNSTINTHSNSTTTNANSKFVVNGSGLSVDVAAAANQQLSAKDGTNNNNNLLDNNTATTSNSNNRPLHEILPVTVEPIDPIPDDMVLGSPRSLQLLVINHSPKNLNLQLQMRLPQMSGVVVCGPSFRNLGNVTGSGGSVVVGIRLVALLAGLFKCKGCWIVDLDTGLEIAMPSLFDVFVEKKCGGDGDDVMSQ